MKAGALANSLAQRMLACKQAAVNKCLKLFCLMREDALTGRPELGMLGLGDEKDLPIWQVDCAKQAKKETSSRLQGWLVSLVISAHTNAHTTGTLLMTLGCLRPENMSQAGASIAMLQQSLDGPPKRASATCLIHPSTNWRCFSFLPSVATSIGFC